MFHPKAVLQFAAVFVVAFLPLWGFASKAQTAYAPWFRGVGNACFASQFWFWSDGRVVFLDNSSDTLVSDINRVIPGELPEDFKKLRALEKRGERDTLLVLLNRTVPTVPGFTRTSSHMIGYAPTAVVIALALATPIAWRRRAWLLLVATVLVHGLIVLRLTVVILKNGFAAEKRFALFHPSEFWWDVLSRADLVLADNPTIAYLSAVFPWILALLVVSLYPLIHARVFAKRRTRRAKI